MSSEELQKAVEDHKNAQSLLKAGYFDYLDLIKMIQGEINDWHTAT